MKKRNEHPNVTKDFGNSTQRLRIHDDELELIKNYRSLWNEALELGQNPLDVKHGWIKSKDSDFEFFNLSLNGSVVFHLNPVTK